MTSSAPSSHPRFATYVKHARQQDLKSRSVLSDPERNAVVAAAVTALPLESCERVREFEALIDDGCPADLAEDIIIQMAAYMGYPKVSQALQGFEHARSNRGREKPPAPEAPADSTPKGRYERGIEDYNQLNPDALSTIRSAFGGLSHEFIDMTFQAFGDVFASSRQPLQLRQLATVSALSVMGTAAPQLRFHINAAFHVGVVQEKIMEVIAWTQFFAGMPAAYNAMVELKAALEVGAAPAYK